MSEVRKPNPAKPVIAVCRIDDAGIASAAAAVDCVLEPSVASVISVACLSVEVVDDATGNNRVCSLASSGWCCCCLPLSESTPISMSSLSLELVGVVALVVRVAIMLAVHCAGAVGHEQGCMKAKGRRKDSSCKLHRSESQSRNGTRIHPKKS